MGMFIGGRDDSEPRGGGSWWTRCKADSRFDMGGQATGMFGGNSAINEAIKSKAKELDMSDEELDKLEIEVGFMKD